MDKNKLDVSGKESADTVTVNATYKPIPEAETDYMEDPTAPRLNSHVKNHNSPEADGAHEKMLPEDDSKLPHHANMGVTIIPSAKSPDKITDGLTLEIRPLVVGMGKEELMKYANDPFWIRLRWILFICFWLLWAGMLVGAILIIIAAPKCAPPQPKTWWETGPLTEIDLDASVDELKELKQHGVQGVISDWPLDTYKSLDESNEFKNFLQKAKQADLNVIVGLEPGSSRVFFNDSESKADAYVNYYLWQKQQPNNWLTPNDTSAWIYSNIRKEYYYAPFDNKPWLNFRDEKVQEEFSKVVTNFLKAGAHGVRLNRGSYLLVDKDLPNESIGTAKNSTIGQYNFYDHHKTKDQVDLGPLLKIWRDIVKNKTENGPFMLKEDLQILDPYKVNSSLIIDLPRHSQALNQKMTSGVQIQTAVDSAYRRLEKNWPVWESSDTGLDRDVIDIVTFLLPGTTIIPRNHTVNKELLTYRKSPSVMYGSFETFSVSNDTTFAYIRVTPSNPGYLVALNPTDETVKVNFPKDTGGNIQDEVTVQFVSNNYNITDVEVKVKISSKAVLISPKAAIILTYVPKA